ncbi:gliding motility-associated C-terminal domain-containing protein [bacterium]|nr:gliding motility-associated C-terminal domain-containing protein [bacterium]
MKKTFIHFSLWLLLSGVIYGIPYQHIDATLSDFSAGDTILVVFIMPDPDGMDDCAISLSGNDTIRVLQIYPDGHCRNCIADAVATYMHDGRPSLNIKFDIIPISEFNSITSPDDLMTVYDPYSGAPAGSRAMTDYHIIMFGIANGYGGRSNDLSGSARNAVIAYGRSGGGVMLTHDTIAKRRGWSVAEPWCLDSDYQHPRFNNLTPITGLDADWVPCAEPDNIYTHVTRDASADPTANVLHYPFELPEEFDVTQCHAFGEHYADPDGQVWYRGPDNQIYMHTFHDLEYDAFGCYFSTGHQEEYDGTSFRPLEWETKAMINTMFFSFYGGIGNGIYTSAPIDAGCPVSLDSVHLSATLPGSSYVIIELRTSDDGVVWSDWYEVTSGASIPPPISHSRYFQYRLSLSLGTPADDPPIVHWFGLFGVQDVPEAEMIYPPFNSTTACSCGVIKFLISSDSPLDLTGCQVVFNGISYGASTLHQNGDTLIFTPPDCFTDGEHYEGTLTNLLNTSGCSNDSVNVPFSFFADLSPPEYSIVFPAPGDTVGPDPIVSLTIIDETTGLDITSISGDIDGTDFDVYSVGVSFDGDTLIINTSSLGSSYGGEIEICIGASDSVPDYLCGPNSSDTCWLFYVDTVAPDYAALFGNITACESLEIRWWIYDTAAVDTTSITILCDGIEYNYPDGMVYRNDTLYFSPGMPLDDGDTISVLLEVSDVFGNTVSSSEWDIIIDRSPPQATFSPSDGESVMNPQPALSFCIWDNISGLDTSSIILTLDTDSFSLGSGIYIDSCFFWSAESLGLFFTEGETLEFCLSASDVVPDDECGPNILDTCISITINLPGPIGTIIYPDDGIFSSCSLQTIVAVLSSGEDLVADSIIVAINGDTIGTGDSRLNYSSDTLKFMPDVPFNDGDTVRFYIIRAVDELGASSDNLDSVIFYIDLSPPVVDISISDGDTIHNPLIGISINSSDDGCGISGCSLWVDGTFYEIDDCDSIIFNPSDYDVCFAEGESHSIDYIVYDCAQNCGENTTAEHIEFFIPDDDTIPPDVIYTYPSVWAEDSVFKIVIALVDSSGIYAPANPLDEQDAYLLWDNDGELTIDANRSELSIDSIFGDTIYMSSENIPEQPAGSTFVWQAFYFDNDFDCENSDDRSPDSTDINNIVVIRRPHLEMVYPSEGIFTSCVDLTIKLYIDSEDPIDLASLKFVVLNDTLQISDSRVGVSGDTILILPPTYNYSEGEIVIELIDGRTTAGYELSYQQWSFYIDLTAPNIDFVEPSDGEMLPEPVFDAVVNVFDDASGIDTSSADAYFIIEDDTVSAAVHLQEYMSGWRLTIPSAGDISPGDSLSLTVNICDNAEICPPNCSQRTITFWIEPNFPCSLSTNPFTPNGDGFNDEVMFYYPRPLTNRVELCIYDLGGREMFCREIPPGSIKDMKWNGTRNGKKLPAGTYLYTITNEDGMLCSGTITIAR